MINLPEAKQLLDDPYYLNIENRLTTISLYLGIGVTSLSLILGELTFAGSFLIGAILSFLNFSWMKQGIDRLLSSEIQEKLHRPFNRKILFKYFLRYVLIGGTLYAIFRFRFFDVTAAILGLLLFVAAILYECIVQVIKGLLEDRKRGGTSSLD